MLGAVQGATFYKFVFSVTDEELNDANEETELEEVALKSDNNVNKT